MTRTTRLTVALTAGAALAAGWAGSGTAAPTEPPFGQHVSACASELLGKRANPPQVTCEHDDHVHTFANFGELVQHMKEMHA